MSPLTIVTPELNEQAWTAWIRKGEARDRSMARRWRILGGILIPSALVIGAVYAFLLRG